MGTRMLCEECGWGGPDEDVLNAKNPFDPEDRVSGCPYCKEVNTVVTACQWVGCTKPGSMGTPLKNGGYTYTCWDHQPLESERK